MSVVTLGPYTVAFVFSDDTRLVVQSRFDFVDTQGVLHAYDVEAGVDAVAFHPLVRGEERIILMDVSDWRLSLTFASGRKLVIHSDSGPYECGQIGRRGGVIVF